MLAHSNDDNAVNGGVAYLMSPGAATTGTADETRIRIRQLL